MTEQERKIQIKDAFEARFHTHKGLQIYLFPSATFPGLTLFEAFVPQPGRGRGAGPNAQLGMRGVIKNGSVISDPAKALTQALKDAGFPAKVKAHAAIFAAEIGALEGRGRTGASALTHVSTYERIRGGTSVVASKVFLPRFVDVNGLSALEYWAQSPVQAMQGPTRITLDSQGKAHRFKQDADGKWQPDLGF